MFSGFSVDMSYSIPLEKPKKQAEVPLSSPHLEFGDGIGLRLVNFQEKFYSSSLCTLQHMKCVAY